MQPKRRCTACMQSAVQKVANIDLPYPHLSCIHTKVHLGLELLIENVRFISLYFAQSRVPVCNFEAKGFKQFIFHLFLSFVCVDARQRTSFLKEPKKKINVAHHIAVQSKCTISHFDGLNASESAFSIPFNQIRYSGQPETYKRVWS